MSAQKVYLQSVKKPELRYEVIEFNPATQTARLRGERGEFRISPFTKNKITADGYELIKEGANGTGTSD
jgi:hypothetical protein